MLREAYIRRPRLLVGWLAGITYALRWLMLLTYDAVTIAAADDDDNSRDHLAIHKHGSEVQSDAPIFPSAINMIIKGPSKDT